MNAPLTVPIIKEVGELRAKVRSWRAKGRTVALVPTMGALHEGHLTLVRRALQLADRVVVSIFVNPMQFGPNEDFDAYPRRLSEDATLLSGVGAAAVYAPTAATMYPEGYSTRVVVEGVSEGLCGAFRPGHFIGVASVVTKLMLRALPDVALFGEKDYQQLQVIRRMVRDLDIPTRVEGVPTVREPSGVALSSRNAYLTTEEREIAPTLYATLTAMAKRIAAGGSIVEQERWGAEQILKAGFSSIDYLETRCAEGLARLTERLDERPARILVAAHLGKTRLIDNVPVVA